MPRGPGWKRYLKFGRSNIAADIDAEMRFHLEERTRALVERGMPPADARAIALEEFGDPDVVRARLAAIDQRVHDRRRRTEWWDELSQDVRYAVRGVLRRPGFATAVVLTLALGIGATTAIFAAVNGVLLRPFPVADPERTVLVRQRDRDATGGRSGLAPGTFLDLRERATSFDALAAAEPYGFDLRGSEGLESVPARLVSDDFFRAVGTHPFLGRTLGAEDFVPGHENAVVLSHQLWVQRFGGDSSIAGRTITLDDAPWTVTGVLPAAFDIVGGGDFFAPKLFAESERQNRVANYYAVVARLRRGVSLDAARAEMTTLAAALAAEHPRTNANIRFELIPIADEVLRPVRPALLVLLGAVALVLLIACANVANLFLARALERRRELAVRASLGASRARIVRQLITEGLVLAAIGGAAGIALAYAGLEAVRRFSPPDLPRLTELRLDGRVLAFAALVTIAASLLFGALPSVRATSGRLFGALAGGARAGRAGPAARRLRTVLVAGEIALALVLLVGAGLLTRSLAALLRVDRGYRTDHVVAVSVQSWGANPTPARRAAFVRDVIDRLRALPGVRAAGATSALPLAATIGQEETELAIDGRPVPPGSTPPPVRVTAMTPGYLEALEIPLRRGRLLGQQDGEGAPLVALINETLARRYWPDEDPIGKRITIRYLGPPLTREIVGVIGDVRHSGLDETPRPSVFVPHAQAPTGAINFTVRVAQEPERSVDPVKAAIWSVNPGVAVGSATTLDRLLGESLRARRFNLALLGAFSLLAVLLAAIGVYGVMSHVTAERTHEIGVRVALGATPAAVLVSVLRDGGRVAGAGLVLGLAGAAALARLLREMLFGISPLDPWSFATAAVMLLGIALVACVVPAQRAARVDPVLALRGE